MHSSIYYANLVINPLEPFIYKIMFIEDSEGVTHWHILDITIPNP